MIDPNVVGIGEEAMDLDQLSESDITTKPTQEAPDVQIHVDINDPDWEEKVKESYRAWFKAIGKEVPSDDTPVILLKGDPSILEEAGVDYVDKRPK